MSKLGLNIMVLQAIVTIMVLTVQLNAILLSVVGQSVMAPLVFVAAGCFRSMNCNNAKMSFMAKSYRTPF